MQQSVYKQDIPSLQSTLHLQAKKLFLSTEKELNRNMRVAIFVSVMLLVCCLSTDALWGRRRRRSSRTVNANVRVNNGQPTLEGSWTHQGDNWESSVTGSVDPSGNWNVGVGATWHFKKRSVELHGNRYNVTLQVDPCNFKSYDDDRDGIISKEEFYAVFGENEKTDALFDDLDYPTADGVIEIEEFYELAPVTITECADVDEE
ncbi:uncharacterized protein LOC123544858 [Mercenaria mercenaria]|uniref:uncharacterized protein LOC123544858 n=1 Tax=Mercenaria mercenaria TaxID=6596 RepID=UPI001E1E09CC|nr:uncharacterized protein LOC123544858 [Mercenaria mercenaria]